MGELEQREEQPLPLQSCPNLDDGCPEAGHSQADDIVMTAEEDCTMITSLVTPFFHQVNCTIAILLKLNPSS